MSEPRVPRVRQYHLTVVLAGPEDSGSAWEAIRAAMESLWRVNDGERDSTGPGGTMMHAMFVRSGLLAESSGQQMLLDELAWRHSYPLLGPNVGEPPAALQGARMAHHASCPPVNTAVNAAINALRSDPTLIIAPASHRAALNAAMRAEQDEAARKAADALQGDTIEMRTLGG